MVVNEQKDVFVVDRIKVSPTQKPHTYEGCALISPSSTGTAQSARLPRSVCSDYSTESP